MFSFWKFVITYLKWIESEKRFVIEFSNCLFYTNFIVHKHGCNLRHVNNKNIISVDAFYCRCRNSRIRIHIFIIKFSFIHRADADRAVDCVDPPGNHDFRWVPPVHCLLHSGNFWWYFFYWWSFPGLIASPGSLSRVLRCN